MKKTFSLLFVIILYASTVFSQSLPRMFHFSDDSLRLIRGGVESTGLYDEYVIDTIWLSFSQPNYWQLLTSNYNSQTNIPATLVYKGATFDSVGVRFRGMTSYFFVQGQKKSFNIELDWVHNDQHIEGYETLKLLNSYGDPSILREALYLKYSREHIASARGNHVQLFINDQNWGIYVNVQKFDRKHVKEWFVDADATRWRAEKVGGGGGFGAGKSSLNWLGWDTTTYKQYYQIKKYYKPNPWDDLVNTCYVLNNTPNNLLMDSLANYLDIDGSLWFLAHEILFTDDDSYIEKGGMDYYLYFDVGSNRMIPIEYDGNSCMSVQKASQWSPFYKENNTAYPLMNKLMAVPEIRQRYLAHIRTLMETTFDLPVIQGLIDDWAARISTNVQNDPKKIYSFTQFQSELSKLKQFCSTRRNFILNNTEVNRTGPAISNVIYSVEGQNFIKPDPFQPVDITANVTATQGVHKVILYYGTGLIGKFTRVEMFDDGNHNDGVAGDGIYGAQIPAHASNQWVRFYIEALANDTWKTAKYEPQGAEHDVYIYQVKPGQILDSPVRINELMSNNVSAVTDPAGEYDDWVELFNTTAEPVDLSGYHLSDKQNQLDLWQFPQGTIINGNSYLIVWCDNDLGQEGLHANFALSKDGEQLYLSTPNLLVADEVVFGPSDPDMAYARVPNGTGNFVWQEPTFNGPNDLPFFSPMVINELMPNNTNSIQDPDGEYDDWIEFYNYSSDTCDLSGYYLSDNANQLNKWQFPDGTTVQGHGYLIVWCDNDLTQQGLHTNFSLNNSSGAIYLSGPDMEPVDEVVYASGSPDIAYARVPNGVGDFVWQQHTFNDHNGPFIECDVVVNELMADNVSAVQDPDDEYDDWVELYNNSSQPFDLSGFYLSDKINEPNRWEFPEGTVIEGNGYLIVWCDNDLNQEGLHANFSLSKNGENVILASPYIQIIDQVTYGFAPTDTAYARVPNGVGNFIWQHHTFNGPNNIEFDCQVVINELMPDNTQSVQDPNGEYDDWIEFYNNSTEPCDLSGCYLTDDYYVLNKWQFPEGTVIEGNGYLIVWCDNDLGQEGLHANFTLDNNSGALYFSDPFQQIVDEVVYEGASPDSAYARLPNGVGEFVWKAHTFNLTNDYGINVEERQAFDGLFAIFPNPATKKLTVIVNDDDPVLITIYNLLGEKVLQVWVDHQMEINTAEFHRGIYFVHKQFGGMEKLILR